MVLQTGVGFQPDLVWIKQRSGAQSHYLYDALRTATEYLQSNSTVAETTKAEGLTSFDSDGFSVGNDNANSENTETYVAWCWKANGTGSSNTSGTINTTATSANTTAGFSISTYTGTGSAATIGHGLGIKPRMIIVKSRANTGNWFSQHGSLGATKTMTLNVTSAVATNSGSWNDAEPTTTLFTVGTEGDTNYSDGTYVVYCFVEKQGFSKFGSYEGNGNADGTFVYTGFRPAYVMTKSVDSTSAWHVFDNKREGYNVDNDALEANDSAVEATADQIGILSNGFKLRIATDPNVAETYIYAAFAEAPFVNSNGVPCNAR
jgi:hypothetical protein